MWRRLALLLPLPLLLGAASTTFLDLPDGHPPTNVTTVSFGASDDLMNCVDWVEPIGITNATGIVLDIAGGAGTAAGYAIYSTAGSCPESGSCLIATTGVQSNWNTPGVKGPIAVSAFSLVEGTMYRECWCQNGTGGALRTATAGSAATVVTWRNAVVVHTGTAGTCTNGDPPAATGALSAANLNAPWIRLHTADDQP